MFIRSKYKHNQEEENVGICRVRKTTLNYTRHAIAFKYSFGKYYWKYNSEEDRDQEYEWIMKQVDCGVNAE